MKKKVVLLKDLVIPAGTVLNQIPGNTRRTFVSDEHFECTVGLSRDTCGSFTYCLSDVEDEKLREFFDIGDAQ